MTGRQTKLDFDEILLAFKAGSPYFAYYSLFKGLIKCDGCHLPVKSVVMTSDRSGVCGNCFNPGMEISSKETNYLKGE